MEMDRSEGQDGADWLERSDIESTSTGLELIASISSKLGKPAVCV